MLPRTLSFLLPGLLALFIVSCGRGDEERIDGTSTPIVAPVTTPTTVIEATVIPVPDEPTNSTPLVSAVSPTVEGTSASEEVDIFFTSPEYGIQAFLWWRPNIAERDLALIEDMDFGWVKQSFAWRDIESIEKGKYDWWRSDQIVNATEDAGLNLLVRIDRQPFWSQEPGADLKENIPPADYDDFGDFCGALAERYVGRIDAYQVWNEPNLSREWGDRPPDPAEYTKLLKICYQAIKVVDPGAIVISAGLAPTGTGLPIAIPDTEFLQGMYDAGAADYFDVLGLNAPGYKAPPETPPEEGESNPDFGGGRWFVFRHVEDMREIMVDNGDGAKQAAILELGWTTDVVHPEYAWHAVNEEEQADYLVRAYTYATENWQPWIGLITAIYIADYDWTPEEDEQWWWSITLPDGTPRPAYFALRDMEKSGP
ncbi:MAG TPA: hypothetical protein VFI27_09460 [candidate division Zixibacteria bacterium]|nr:hypothetical protein [candidate division Zixibacteria bacterium]